MECQKMNITPKVILSNFRSFPISPVRESCSSLFFDFPPWGKVVFRWFLVFPREGKPIFDDFLFSPVRESWFLLIFDFPPWGKADFNRFFDFPSRGIICFRRFLPVVPLRKLLFPVFRSSYPISGQFFPKIDDLLPYLSRFSRKSTIYSRIWMNFPKKQRKRPFLCSQRVLKWSFLIGLF